MFEYLVYAIKNSWYEQVVEGEEGGQLSALCPTLIGRRVLFKGNKTVSPTQKLTHTKRASQIK